MIDRPGLSLVARAPAGERVLQMIEYKGRILVATESGVYEFVESPNGNTRLRPIEFVKARADPS